MPCLSSDTTNLLTLNSHQSNSSLSSIPSLYSNISLNSNESNNLSRTDSGLVSESNLSSISITEYTDSETESLGGIIQKTAIKFAKSVSISKTCNLPDTSQNPSNSPDHRCISHQHLPASQTKLDLTTKKPTSNNNKRYSRSTTSYNFIQDPLFLRKNSMVKKPPSPIMTSQLTENSTSYHTAADHHITVKGVLPGQDYLNQGYNSYKNQINTHNNQPQVFQSRGNANNGFNLDFNKHPKSVEQDKYEPNEILAKYKVGEWTNFHMAAYQDWNEDSIKSLDISLLNMPDPSDGRNPIHIACQYDNYRFLKCILSFYELDLNAIDHNGFTALHIAAKHGHERCLNILILTNKVDLNLGGFDCPTPLHLAVANEENGCVRTLLAAGANVNWRKVCVRIKNRNFQGKKLDLRSIKTSLSL